jgi:hypothetical protein
LPDFLPALAARDRHLPACVQEEFDAYLKCGRLEHGFLRSRCTTCPRHARPAVSAAEAFTVLDDLMAVIESLCTSWPAKPAMTRTPELRL